MTLTTMEILQEDISDARKESTWDNRYFVPRNEIETLITKDRIKAISVVRPENAFDTSLKVIAILCVMGRVDALDNWLTEGLTDNYLPVEYDAKEKVFVKKVSAEVKKTFKPFSDKKFICRIFVEKQWDFLAPVLVEGDMKLTKIDKSCPLPIIWPDTKRGDESHDAKTDGKYPELHKPHDQGAFGVVYEIKIHHAHTEPRRTEGNEPKLAFKELSSDYFEGYEQEEIALRKIHQLNDDHLIKVIASIKRGEKYYFLFPWADGGDLRRVWEVLDKTRRTPELVRWVFEEMKGIAGAIAKLHSPSNTSEENGRHGDLKPANILLFPNKDFPNKGRRGTLVITDVGLTRFHAQVTNKRVNKTETTDASIDYGPPEALKDDVRSRKYDLWSLGCIFLEFTIWIFGGIGEQVEFMKARTGPSRDCPYYSGNYKGKTLPKVHPMVSVYISRLRKESRCGRCGGFNELLDIIENDLIKVNINARIAASALEARLEDILRKTDQNISYLFYDPNKNGYFYPKRLPKDLPLGLNRMLRR